MLLKFLSVGPDTSNASDTKPEAPTMNNNSKLMLPRFPFSSSSSSKDRSSKRISLALPSTTSSRIRRTPDVLRSSASSTLHQDDTYTTQDDLDDDAIRSAAARSHHNTEITADDDDDDDDDSCAPQQQLKSCLKVKTLEESLSMVTPLWIPPMLHAPPQRLLQHKHVVQWGRVEFREYQVCLGDNPACRDGAPIQLSWNYKRYKAIPVMEFERIRGPPKLERHSSTVRQVWLLQLGYTLQEILAAMDQREEDQRRRMKTITRIKFMALDQQFEKLWRKKTRKVATATIL